MSTHAERGSAIGASVPPGQAWRPPWLSLARLCRWLGVCGWLCWAAAAAVATPATPNAAGPDGFRDALTQYKVDVWQTEQGLPLNTVQAVAQTRDGYLWVGTAGGLARFDGVRFTTFQSPEVPEMASHSIFGFMEDAQNNLWIGHVRGAAIYRAGRFQVALSSELTAGRRVWGFAQAADGAVWAATENGLVRWHDGQTRLYQVADGLPTLRLRSLAFDRAGTLWIATSGGGLVSFADGRFRVMNLASGFPQAQVRAVLADPDGGIWAATAGGGLVRLEDGLIVRTYTVADGLPTNQLTGLARDRQGALWIGTWGAGVVRMSEGRFSAVSTAEGLAGDQIWSVQADREGSVWIGTWFGGLNRLRPRAFVVLGPPEGLSHDNVRAVLHARNGVTWVSTAGGGLNRIEGHRITHLDASDGLPSNEVSTVLEDRQGTVWIGTYTAGVARLRNGRIEAYGVDKGLPSPDVRALSEDAQGTLWVGTQAGLARFDGSGFSAVREPGAPSEGVTSLLQDRSGTLWIGTAGEGLIRYRDGRFDTLTKADGLVSNWIMALAEDADQTLWIGTNGAGINRWRDGRLASIRPADGLWDGLVQTLLEDHQGHFWITSNRGFYRVARAELNAFADGGLARLNPKAYGPGDALRATTFAGGLQAAGAVDAQGQIWLPSARGLVIVDPLRLPDSRQPPPVGLEEVTVDGVSVAPDTADLVLPPGTASLRIRYTAMTLLNAERVRFRYRMDGLTRDWIDAGSSREAAFPAPPHGRFLFRVSASSDGVHWSEPTQALVITVQPRVYQTVWFLALVIAGGLASIVAMVSLRTRNLRARHLEMERLVAQRTEELRLANEHLSRLSFIDALTGLANRRRFDEALATEWRRARREGTPLALLIADIDGFKAYNDQLGHPQGDRCLAAVAGVFAKAAGRAGDLAARYGGEEFVVLLPGARQDAAVAVAEGLRTACEALALPHPASPTGPVITVSVGVASCIPTDQTSIEALISQADEALYRAKQAGRNRVR